MISKNAAVTLPQTAHARPIWLQPLKRSLTLSVWEKKKKKRAPLQQNLCHRRAVSGAFLHALRFQMAPSSDGMKWSRTPPPPPRLPPGGNRLCPQMLSRRLDAAAAATHWYTFHSHSGVAGMEAGRG